MPHIVIKTLSGKSQEVLNDSAEQVAVALSKAMDKPMDSISVSVEEYSVDDWKNVYDEYIDNKDNVLIKPGYTM